MTTPSPDRPAAMLTPEQARARRARNVALSLTIGFLAVLFYGVTIVKLGLRVGGGQ
jgi:hypothetical protein